MTLTVSPYLIVPPSGLAPQPAADESVGTAGAPQTPNAADATQDSVSLSPAAQQVLANTSPPQKTLLQSALEKILTAVQTSTGPTLTFSAATDASTGKTLDQSC
jgi:hypothetical protein